MNIKWKRKLWLSSSLILVLLMGSFADAKNIHSIPLIQKMRCYDRVKGQDLNQGGGPGGSIWNPVEIVCAVDFVDPKNIPSLAYLEVQLFFGQGKSLRLLEKTSLKQFRPSALEEPPRGLEATLAISPRIFLIPHPVLIDGLKQKTKPFDIYPATIVLRVSGLQENGEKISSDERRVEGKFSFGE